MTKSYYVYILTNKPCGVLYIGVTSDLVKRIWEHKNKIFEGFTKKYNLKHLVYYELYDTPDEAIRREKQLKGWRREWKIELIRSGNPKWSDLYQDIVQ